MKPISLNMKPNQVTLALDQSDFYLFVNYIYFEEKIETVYIHFWLNVLAEFSWLVFLVFRVKY